MRRGISLVSLMITIVIMVLLATTVTISATSSINNSRKISFAAEISFIQEAVNNYYIKNNNVPVLKKINFDLSVLEEKYKIEFYEEKNSDNVIELYELDLSKLGQIETVFGKNEKENDIYAISLDTNKVYYIAGLNVGDYVYYTLTDDLKSVIRYTDNSLNDGIVFTKAINKWTNQNINTEILIPSEYTDIEISVKQNGSILKNIYEYTNSEKDNKYVCDSIFGNYSIEVKYSKNGEDKQISFEVNNFDNTNPVYELSDKKTLDNGEEKYSYIELLEVSDALSGISKLKYSKTNVSINDVKEKGIDIKNNVIEFEENIEYITLYIEDNATNYIYEVINVRGE